MSEAPRTSSFVQVAEFFLISCPGPALARRGLRLVAFQPVRGIPGLVAPPTQEKYIRSIVDVAAKLHLRPEFLSDTALKRGWSCSKALRWICFFLHGMARLRRHRGTEPVHGAIDRTELRQGPRSLAGLLGVEGRGRRLHGPVASGARKQTREMTTNRRERAYRDLEQAARLGVLAPLGPHFTVFLKQGEKGTNYARRPVPPHLHDPGDRVPGVHRNPHTSRFDVWGKTKCFAAWYGKVLVCGLACEERN